MSISLSEQHQVQGGPGVVFGAPVVNSASVLIPLKTGLSSGAANFSSNGATVWDGVVDQVNGWYAYDVAVDMTNLRQGRVSCFTTTAGSAGTKAGFVYAPDLTTVGSDLAEGGLYVPVDGANAWTDSGWVDLLPGITGIQHIHLASIGGNNWTNPASVVALYLMFK